ncbi:helix-turn-helix domain-containing protein [Spirosoma terrae]|uniref:Helix-turn-helix domain-containing protein n=1 Tax=Spirosoma terrae TaxID=1968276 RepID=A0A6L9L3P1_9BACT|nr:helix-turn-helix domain-containing protein [Spirosoma terrae]NDU95245.1 helix-turn-helix domain-containing protein [Spirosoma terrae]
MESIPLTFEQLPAYVYQLGRKLDDLSNLLRSQSEGNQTLKPLHFDIHELCEYLPDKPAVTTVYGLVQRREIPFGRRGKKLIFFQSDIDLWLATKKSKTANEISGLADQHKTSFTRGKKGGSRV